MRILYKSWFLYQIISIFQILVGSMFFRKYNFAQIMKLRATVDRISLEYIIDDKNGW